jgi:hypothetical protein
VVAVLCGSAVASLQAQTPTSWVAGNGNWSDAAKWTAGVPNSANADVYVDNQAGTNSAVNLNIAVTIGRLRIDAGDSVTMGSGSVSVLVASNAFPGAGELLLNGIFTIPSDTGNGGTAHGMDGTKTVNGSGKLVLGTSAAIRPEITGVTNNNATIEGAAFFGRPTNPSYPGTINNTGTINANIPGAPIRFYSAANSTNSGVIKATNGGVLDFNQNDINNTGGQILADGANSIATFGNFSVVGGNLAATNGGVLEIRGTNWKNLTVSGPTTVASSTLLVDGTITNNGIITVPAGSSIWTPSNGSGNITLAGTGEIVLDGPEDNLPELIDQGVQQWLIQGQTIRGRGNVGYRQAQGSVDRVSLINQGTFQADRNGETLFINLHSFDNQNGGLLRAIGTGSPAPALGGILRLAMNLPLKNTGGTIEAVSGGRVEAVSSGIQPTRIEGGLIRNLGGTILLGDMIIVNPTVDDPAAIPPTTVDPNGMILEGDLTLGLPTASQEMVLVGEIKNTARLRVATSTSYSHLRIGEVNRPEVRLTGGGEVILGVLADNPLTLGNNNGRILERPDGVAPNRTRTLNNVDNTIHGFGFIGSTQFASGDLSLTNTGTIAADVNGKTLQVESRGTDNKFGTLRASNGGRLDYGGVYGGGVLDNVDGTLEALDNSSFTFFGWTGFISGATVSGGRLVNAPANAINFDLSNATLVNPGSGLLLQGPFVVNAEKTARLINSIRNEGSIRLRGPNQDAILRIGRAGSPSTVMTGGGELILGDPTLGGIGGWIDSDNLSNTAVTLTLGGPGGAAEGQKLHGFGVVGAFAANYDRYLSVINNTGSASGPTPIAGIEANVSGKELKFITATLTNPAGKLMRATNGGTLALWNGNLINTDAYIAAGPASTVELGPIGPVTGGFVSSDVGGTIKVPQDATANGGLLFTNAGTMEFGASGGNTFSGLANGGSSIISSGTIRKVGGSDYSVFSPLNSTGAINVESGGGTLRWKANGEIVGATSSVAAGSNLYFQDAPFTFSGVNSFTGPGNHWFFNNTVTLADAATTLTFDQFRFGSPGPFGPSVITGPGTINVSGGLRLEPQSTTFSGTRLITLAGSSNTINKGGSPLQFTNGATWENRGLTTSANFNTIDGEAGTLFTNTATGTLRANNGGSENILAMPFENSGLFDVVTGRLQLTKSGTFKNGSSATIGTPWEMWLRSAPLAFEGTSNVTGFGIMRVDTSPLTFASGAKLNAEGIVFSGNSSATGGELNVGKVVRFEPLGLIQTMSGTQINLAADVLGDISLAGGTLRLQNGAHLTNGGSLTVVAPGASALTTDRPGWNGEGSETIKTLSGSKLRFNLSATMSWPFDFAGEIYAEGGSVATFDKGGLFNETAKILPNHPSAEITFTGPTPFHSRGDAVEMNGTGYVNFKDTTLIFDPSTIPGDVSGINAGARVAFHGNNTIKSSAALLANNMQGTLNSSGFVFQNGDQTVDNAILKTSGPDDSVWNATGRKLTLINGAKFLNTGRFVIPFRVGSGVTGDPGITSDLTNTLFHNTSTGRIVHDINTRTEFNVAFLNEGFLEFRSGEVAFLRSFRGRGGIAASNGARVSLSLAGVPESEQPAAFELNGTGSQISVNLAAGQNLAASITLNGGQMVAAGGLNMVAAGGLNLVAAGGGNLVAAGGMNMVAAGAGNITATGAGSLITGNAMVAAGAGNIISQNGSAIVAAGGLNADGGSVTANGGTIRNEGSAPMVAAGAGNILSHNGGVMVAAGAGNILSHNGGVMVAAGAGNIKAESGAPMVAAGGGNLVAAGGGNLVAAGGGNIVAAGGLNRGARSLELIANRMVAAKAGLSQSSATNAEQEGSIDMRAALMRSYAEVNSDLDIGIVTVEAGGNATAQNGGSIVAEEGGILKGAGTFTGPGLVQNGGAIMPGSSAGVLTWTGNLTVESGGLLDIEIGGTTADTQYDRVNVSGTFTMNGSLGVKMINGFGGSVQPTDVFDIVVAGSPISTGLAGTRIPAAGSYGSFAVQLVNGGNTLRLTDFQSVAPTFSNWANRYGLSGADAGPMADPNHNGNPNILDYALGLDPTVGGSTGINTGMVEESGQKYLTLSYTKPTGAEVPTDIIYTPQRASSLALPVWSSSLADIIPLGSVPGPGNLETVTVRSTHPISTISKEFLRLQVTLTP